MRKPAVGDFLQFAFDSDKLVFILASKTAGLAKRNRKKASGKFHKNSIFYK